MPDQPPFHAPAIKIKDAASVIVMRQGADGQTQVLLGRRSGKAAFMPSKVVFPGGAVEPDDTRLSLPLAPLDRALLDQDSQAPSASALAAAAIRELWEETGLALGQPAKWGAPTALLPAPCPNPPYAPAGPASAYHGPPHHWPHTHSPVPEAWQGFAALGLRPDALPLRFVFRAITPPGHSRRFDARFFVLEASALASDPDDFSAASGELTDLGWVDAKATSGLDLAFITQIILSEALAAVGAPPLAGSPRYGAPTLRQVAFSDGRGPRPVLRWLTLPEADQAALTALPDGYHNR